jgi:hypothetical protein
MNNFFFFVSDAYGHPHPASLTSELEERAPASKTAGNHVPRGQTLRGTTLPLRIFMQICEKKKKLLFCAIRDISAKTEANILPLSIVAAAISYI